MAGILPPAVPLQPVVANVLAAPITDEMPVVLDATEMCVLATPFLEWTAVAAAGAVARVSIPHWRMLRAFIARCSIAGVVRNFSAFFLTLGNFSTFFRTLRNLSAFFLTLRNFSAFFLSK